MPALPDPQALNLQQMPPKWAHFCLGVERFLLHDLLQNTPEHLTLSVSGGVDSTALLCVLFCLRSRLQCSLSTVHLDHGIREDSGGDAAFVQELCSSLKIPCRVERCDVPALSSEQGIGIEEAGRLARAELLARELHGHQPTHAWAVVGHQLDDLAEDQLMRQVRGAGWPALGGMRALLPEQRLVRPLLLTPKAKLCEFLQALQIPWREDPSNQDARFMRNRVRRELLPLLLRENPAYLQTAAALWRQARLDAGFWERETDRILARARRPSSNVLLLSDALLEECAEALRLRVYKRCLESLGPGQPLAETLFQLDAAWRQRRLDARLQFPGGKEGQVTAQGIEFCGEEERNTR